MEPLERLEREAERLKKELAEVETAVRVLRRMDVNGNDKAHHATSVGHSVGLKSRADLSDATIMQAALMVLSDLNGDSVHYKSIADAALKRGYSSPRSSKADSVRQSFWATMKRKPELFDAVGRGRFRMTDKGREQLKQFMTENE